MIADFIARENHLREQIKGWTHHNAELAAASADGFHGMLSLMRFRKRK